MLLKVTIFVTRNTSNGTEILLLRHPYDGIQFPAGTVNPGEIPHDAALRELSEETGILTGDIQAEIGYLDEELPENYAFIIQPAPVYSRPDETSFNWATIPAGKVMILRQSGDFLHVTYEEGDRFPDPNYATYQITGWVQNHNLVKDQRRYLYHVSVPGMTPEEWEQFSDNHMFKVFWCPINSLPAMVFYQKSWFTKAVEQFKYEF